MSPLKTGFEMNLIQPLTPPSTTQLFSTHPLDRDVRGIRLSLIEKGNHHWDQLAYQFTVNAHPRPSNTRYIDSSALLGQNIYKLDEFNDLLEDGGEAGQIGNTSRYGDHISGDDGRNDFGDGRDGDGGETADGCDDCRGGAGDCDAGKSGDREARDGWDRDGGVGPRSEGEWN